MAAAGGHWVKGSFTPAGGDGAGAMTGEAGRARLEDMGYEVEYEEGGQWTLNSPEHPELVVEASNLGMTVTFYEDDTVLEYEQEDWMEPQAAYDAVIEFGDDISDEGI